MAFTSLSGPAIRVDVLVWETGHAFNGLQIILEESLKKKILLHKFF